MLVAVSWYIPARPIPVNKAHAIFMFHYLSDYGHLLSGLMGDYLLDLLGDASSKREQQLIILAAGQHDRLAIPPEAYDGFIEMGRKRQRCRFDHSPHTTFFTNMPKVTGETIADICHRCSADFYRRQASPYPCRGLEKRRSQIRVRFTLTLLDQLHTRGR